MIFKCYLKNDPLSKVEVSLSLARQFNFHRNYPLALVTSLTNIAKLSLSSEEINMFVELILKICKELGGARNLVTSSLVDIILQWTLPKLNKRKEIYQAKSALHLTKTLSVTIFEESVNSFQFLYHQLRARLLGASKSDVQEDCNYGNLCFETKSILLDILIVLARARSPPSAVDFLVEDHLDVVEAVREGDSYENVNTAGHNIVDEKPINTSRDSDRSVVVETTSLCKRSQSVKLLTPKMFEEESTRSLYTRTSFDNNNSFTLPAKKSDCGKCEVLPSYQNPVDQILHSQVDNENILGFLNSNGGDYSVPVLNNSCIGK